MATAKVNDFRMLDFSSETTHVDASSIRRL